MHIKIKQTRLETHKIQEMTTSMTPLLLKRIRMFFRSAMVRSMSAKRSTDRASAPCPRPALMSLTTSFGYPVYSSSSSKDNTVR
uniref:Uncharacterized protein n=1 Tax=Brassica oleracea var. oleracea TaxID=109376 RepID=A0A0D3BIT1_BRAOL